MKNKGILILYGILLLGAFTAGATGLIKPNKSTEGNGQDLGDRLVGMLVTWEPLRYEGGGWLLEEQLTGMTENGFDQEDTIHLGPENSDLQGNRLYAKKIVKKWNDPVNGEEYVNWEYVFENVDGLSFFHYDVEDGIHSYGASKVDHGFSQVSEGLKVNGDTSAQSHFLEGIIYFSSQGEKEYIYINPVYQSSQGEVYALPGDCYRLGVDGELPLWFNTTVSLKEEVEDYASETKVKLAVMAPPEKVVVLQYGADQGLLGKQEFEPGTLPEEFDTLKGTQFIVVETIAEEGSSFELFQKGDSFIGAFYATEQELCVRQDSQVNWK